MNDNQCSYCVNRGTTIFDMDKCDWVCEPCRRNLLKIKYHPDQALQLLRRCRDDNHGHLLSVILLDDIDKFIEE